MIAAEPSPAAYKRAGQLVLQALERIAREDAAAAYAAGRQSIEPRAA